jgi:hypothetical protein
MTIGAVLLLMVVFAYMALPGLIGSSLAANLKERHGLQEKPMVEVYSDFPPELLLGHIDRMRYR